ncbi:cohesin subunit SA-2-like isoform X3 [Leptopilina boulardi]|uniref:cohesin subunit SA-2-like isoform X3 n=1 Tax=Leptopilina boulardi TaxID=63433 RepID=UPI0021F68AEF|nr:cohesin subunit SA-2-like isoform X3 [Leptopilina boulardi]
MSGRRGSRIPIEDTSETTSEVPDSLTDSTYTHESPKSSSTPSLVDYSPLLSQPSKLPTRRNILHKPKSHNSRSRRKLSIRSSTSSSTTAENFREQRIQLKHLNEKTSLFYYVKNGMLLNGIVDAWIKEYKISQADGVLLLMQFIMDSVGCKKFITSEMYNSLTLINDIDKTFSFTDDGKYLFIRTGLEWKEFYENFSHFIEILIEKCHKSDILYDNYFEKKFLRFLIKLSKSHYQGFRHTSTLAGVKIISSLVKINKSLENSSNNVSGSESDMENSRVNKLIVELFEEIFGLRFIDIFAKIRLLCIQEFDIWLKIIPELFIKEDCLKYIGRSIFDSDAEVRLKCLEILKPLYTLNTTITKIEHFTTKFKKRLIAMTLDVNPDVDVVAMQIVIEILQKQPKILDADDLNNIFKLVFDSYQPLARLAGTFLKIYISTSPESDNDSITSDGISNTNFIRDLVIFFSEFEDSLPNEPNTTQCANLFVDSLFNHCEIIKDWEFMTNILLDDDESFNEEMKTSLIFIMISSIKQAATGEIPKSRESKQKVTANSKRIIKQDQEKITKHFIKILPDLIVKYKLDDKNLANLLLISEYFDLNVYTKFKEEDYLDLLLVEIQGIITTTTNCKLLKNAIAALQRLCTEGYAIFNRCDTVRSRIIDKVIQSYKRNVEDSSIANANGDNSDEYFLNLTQDLMRISNLYKYFDLNPWRIWDLLLEHTIDAFSINKEQSFPDEGTEYCLMSLYFSILYDRRHLKDWIDSDSQIEERCNQLRDHLDTFMELMIDIINEENIRKPVAFVLKEKAHTLFCDLLLIFCNQLESHPNPLMQKLVYETNSEIVNAIYNFLVNYVFNDDDDEGEVNEKILIERLNIKRKLLSNYCKLIAYMIIPMKCASPMFTYYDTFNKKFGDLFKDTIIEAMNINRVNCALTLLNSLIILFEKLIDENDKININSKEFIAIKELAKKFAILFGTNADKNSEAMSTLHRTGINFSLQELENSTINFTTPPLYLSFLNILFLFTNKLLKKDKVALLKYLDDHLEWDIESLSNDKWLSLKLYRASLNYDEGKKISKEKKSTPSRKSKLEITKTIIPRKITSGYSASLKDDDISSDERSSIPIIEDSTLSPSTSSSNADNATGAYNPEIMDVSSIENSGDWV